MADLPPLDTLESMRAFELKAALKAVNLDTEGPRSDLVRLWDTLNLLQPWHGWRCGLFS
jgi:hypothetical protein